MQTGVHQDGADCKQKMRVMQAFRPEGAGALVKGGVLFAAKRMDPYERHGAVSARLENMPHMKPGDAPAAQVTSTWPAMSVIEPAGRTCPVAVENFVARNTQGLEIEYHCGMTAKPAGDNNLLPYVAAAMGGLMTCMAIALATGRREAWDAGAYYSAGIPIMVVLIFIIAWVFPERPWRWTLAMAAGQSLSAFLQGSSLSLFPIAIVFMTVVSIPQFIAGYAAARWSRSRDAAGA